MVEFPSSEILLQGFQKAFGAQKGLREQLLKPATVRASTSQVTTQQLFSISKAFGGAGRVGEKIPRLNVGQLQFLLSERLQKATGQVELKQVQQSQQKAESNFLANIQGAINKQLESFKPPQVQQTAMIESESQVKQVEQSPTSLIPLAIIGAVLLG